MSFPRPASYLWHSCDLRSTPSRPSTASRYLLEASKVEIQYFGAVLSPSRWRITLTHTLHSGPFSPLPLSSPESRNYIFRRRFIGVAASPYPASSSYNSYAPCFDSDTKSTPRTPHAVSIHLPVFSTERGHSALLLSPSLLCLQRTQNDANNSQNTQT